MDRGSCPQASSKPGVCVCVCLCVCVSVLFTPKLTFSGSPHFLSGQSGQRGVGVGGMGKRTPGDRSSMGPQRLSQWPEQLTSAQRPHTVSFPVQVRHPSQYGVPTGVSFTLAGSVLVQGAGWVSVLVQGARQVFVHHPGLHVHPPRWVVGGDQVRSEGGSLSAPREKTGSRSQPG